MKHVRKGRISMNENFEIPVAIGTEYNYIMARRHGRVLLVAGQIAKTARDQIHAVGRCGEDVDLATARESAKLAAGQVIAWTYQHLEPGEYIEAILRTSVYVAVGDAPFDISAVADAASDTFLTALQEAGRHPRSVVGVSRLPRNAPVLLEVMVGIGSRDSQIPSSEG